MGLNFIRRPSDTPTVNNTDDARMIRYAYGGANGYVKDAGDEVNHTVSGTTFRINRGIIVLQGWETAIDSNGWTMSITQQDATKRYFSVYYEVNLATMSTDIKSLYDTARYPVIDEGDDLTANTSGIARLLLYTFDTQNGIISNVSKKIEALQYYPKYTETAEEGDISDRIASTEFVDKAFKRKNLYVHHGYVYHGFSDPVLPATLSTNYYFISEDPDPYSSVSELLSGMLSAISVVGQSESQNRYRLHEIPCNGVASYLLNGTRYIVISSYFSTDSSLQLYVYAVCTNNGVSGIQAVTRVNDYVSSYSLT